MNFVTEYGKGVHNFFTFQWLLCLWNCRAAASWRCRGSEPRLPRAIGRGGTRSDKATADGGDPVAATRVKISTCPRHWVARSSPLFIAFRMRRLLKKLAYAESGLRQPLLRALWPRFLLLPLLLREIQRNSRMIRCHSLDYRAGFPTESRGSIDF